MKVNEVPSQKPSEVLDVVTKIQLVKHNKLEEWEVYHWY